MARYVALLRGINVGGKNIIKMLALKTCFEEAGFKDVATFIQSGNVLFAASGAAPALTKQIESILGKAFSYQASVVLRSDKQLAEVVKNAPKGFGSQPAKYRYDVLFLKEPLTASEALKGVRTKPGVDTAHAGQGVLYFSRLISKATQSQLPRLTALPVYQSLTIRNWNTTTQLLHLLFDEA
ncbi:MAG TPA: DUF1697 domain-containing protein, partial [Polyangiaceae bacterium]|nr:DUF1697 domain-containing protein [Polyangiaceae bacterium]